MQTPNCTSSVLQTVQKNWWSTRTLETLHASLMAYIIRIVWSIQEQNSCVIELFPITAHTVGTLPWIIYFPFGYVWHYPGIAVLKIPSVDTCTFSLVWLAVVAGCASSPCELAFIMRQTSLKITLLCLRPKSSIVWIEAPSPVPRACWTRRWDSLFWGKVGIKLMVNRSSSCFFSFWIGRFKWVSGSQG